MDTKRKLAKRRVVASLAAALASLGLAVSVPAWAQDSGVPTPPEAPAQAAAPEPARTAEPGAAASPDAPAPAATSVAEPVPATAPAATTAPASSVASPGAEPSAVPVAAPQAAASAPIGVDASELPRDLSPVGMFMQADIVVKAVMIGLAFASFVTWTIWLAKSLEIAIAKRKLRRAFRSINGAASLGDAAQKLGRGRSIVRAYIEQATLELKLSQDVSDKAGISERVSSRVTGLSTAAGRSVNRGTGVLATIASTAPFVGLFGTVWGIMNSFIGISEAQTTNLAIVAPGIAEALLATAIGLVAAIPAVIIYNHFSRSISAYKAALNDAADEVMRIVSRDLDRGVRAVVAEAAE